MNNRKTPKAIFSPQVSKISKYTIDPESFLSHKPSWQISMIEMKDPCGWHNVDESTLHAIRIKLSNFESMTWKEILGSKSHLINRDKLSKSAQKHLQELKLDDVDQVLSLRLSSTERIFGILRNGIVKLLWWDPEHLICPSTLKYT